MNRNERDNQPNYCDFEHMETLQISPSMLDWAALKAGKTLESLAGEIVAERNRGRFLKGNLTVPQLEKVAALTNTPFGFLFLPAPPPIEKPVLPDLRQVMNPDPFGSDFFELLEDVKKKQDWFIDYLKEAGADPLPFIGRFSKNTPIKTVADDIAKAAGITYDLRKSAATPEKYFSALSERFESIGILVLKSGIVRSNTSKGLSVAEFRGFAICDDYAPLVFINGKDSEAAWVFTLAHEIAHIWIGESAVSDLPAPNEFKSVTDIEYICNKVAAELLTPAQEFIDLWDRLHSLDQLARHFKVSRLVVARRAYDLGKIDKAAYSGVYAASWKTKTSSGGSPYNTIPVRNSKRLTNALVKRTMEGNVLIRDAARLLNVTPGTVTNLYKKNIRPHV
ncbi:ImmA/IrrE family metallo-endopeptidase [Pseudomonas fragariae (ex Marin et al. 2024)]|uniref:ImmA/IrrE family metallo-endopeptidase n=1 Tax=Pseudomonas TaxID=286 RepID=UPI00044A71B4|nr:ImmA/IrrE family metallo-endopeptidase [Pseudomonas syringae]AKF48513.1 putative Zn peptidase [Pseudomonas syringae pv. syringae B301D]EXL31022.1 putative DNA-binding protein with peptidase domain protein [Pseudomonas syringae pv. syringae str. B301D-R]